LIAAADHILAQRQDPTRAAVFTTVAQAWIEQRFVRLHYRAFGHEVERTHRFALYLLEPSPWNDGIYLIGQSDLSPKPLTLKLDRIVSAALLGPFVPPDDFDEAQLLRHAWGIWGGAGEPVTVELKFAAGPTTRRLKESIWHPLEEVTDLPDGGCLWQAPIADWQEMLPWIRGWGASVEVLGPARLRRVMEEEIRRAATLYQIGPAPTIPNYQLLWAKTSNKSSSTHPLICHLMDVAQVTYALWQQTLPPPLKTQMAGMLQLDVEETGRLIAFWAGLHDLGKASPGFQRKYAPGQAKLAAAGIPFAKLVAMNEPCPHATVTTATLTELLVEITHIDARLARNVAQALGGHHGNWPPPQETQALKRYQIGDEPVWGEMRRELVCALHQIFTPPTVPPREVDDAASNAFFALFSGLVSVADWMGSMEAFFPFCDLLPVDLVKYAAQSGEQACQVLSELDWVNWPASNTVMEFSDLFPFPPNALQQVAGRIAKQADKPSLVIVEAPTGFGKTEAALYMADVWSVRLEQRGMYVAMPTMATSNQMHQRVRDFLAKRFGSASIKPLLVHSRAQWQRPVTPPELNLEDESDPQSVRDMSWFLPKKRALLAPFGVGTVDQALLSVLWTRHFFVRLFGLSHKVIIFDEVHAYDTYMSELFQRLLGWLGKLGTSVVLLSATLPGRTRQALVEAYAGHSAPEVAAAPYPALTWAREDAIDIMALPEIEPRTIALEWCGREPQAIVEALHEALQLGGCAAVICNTVARAQALYRALKEAQVVPEDDLILLHARFPFAWRESTEQRVLARFGKGADRPRKSIVVATQVIEQSLDLDFDFMITDLAPIDLLIQRAGRLHRHPRDLRPAPVRTPRLLLTAQADDTGVPELGNDTYIYAAHVLYRSFAVLVGRSRLVLPAMTPTLIDAVYNDAKLPSETTLSSPLAPALQAELLATHAKLEQQVHADSMTAQQRLVSPAAEHRFLRQRSAGLEEDNPELHAALQALTRLGQPSIQLVCCFEDQAGVLTTPDGEVVLLKGRPDAVQLTALMRATVAVTHPALRRHFIRKVGVPTAWRDHAHLRDYFPVIFRNGKADLIEAGYRLQLSAELGLEIERLDRAVPAHTPKEEV
jgi:CRISPR-associated endonuclease/helicase Cas3